MLIKTIFQWPIKLGVIPIFKLPHIQDSVIEKTVNSKKFQDYMKLVEKIPPNIEVKSIQILSVQLFGKNNVGFINLRAVTCQQNINMPSYVFIRGKSVAVLVIINGKILLVEQYRVPIQSFLLQAPAGMLDQSGDFIGVAAKQIQQQTGIKLTHQKLISLGKYFPSPGGCDQQMLMYYTDISIPQQQLQVLLKRIHGQSQHEKIMLKLIDFTLENVLSTGDGKLISLVLAYQKHTKEFPKSKI